MSRIVNRLYERYEDALCVVQALEARGISQNDISLITHNHDLHDMVPKNGAAQGAETGAVAGAALGGGAGLLAGLGMVAVPGIGPMIAAGWLAAAAAGAAVGAGTGALTGGIVGLLAQHGVSRHDAHYYAEALRNGSTLVSVKISDERRASVADAMDRYRFPDGEARRLLQKAAEPSDGKSSITPHHPAATPTADDSQIRH